MDTPKRGWLAVLGGVLVHLSLGTIYTFGNMTPYFTSYIRARGSPENLRYSTSVWIFGVTAATHGLSMFLGGLINAKIGPRWTSLIGGWIMRVTINSFEDSIDIPPRQALCTVHFLILWGMFLFNAMGVLFISTLYKAFGQTFINDDHFLAIVGSVSSIGNSLGRIFWGHFADRFSFKTAMMCLCCCFIAFLLTFIGAQQAESKVMFFIWVCALFWTFSGNFALFPTAIAKTFGTKYMAVNYGLLFTSQAIAGPIGALLTSILSDRLGWAGLFFLTAGLTFLTLILTMLFRAKNRDGGRI